MNRGSQPVTGTRRLLTQEGMSVMGQPGYAPCELPLEAVERIPWLRKRLLSWFARNGRSFPWRDPDRTPYPRDAYRAAPLGESGSRASFIAFLFPEGRGISDPWSEKSERIERAYEATLAKDALPCASRGKTRGMPKCTACSTILEEIRAVPKPTSHVPTLSEPASLHLLRKS